MGWRLNHLKFKYVELLATEDETLDFYTTKIPTESQVLPSVEFTNGFFIVPFLFEDSCEELQDITVAFLRTLDKLPSEHDWEFIGYVQNTAVFVGKRIPPVQKL